MSTSPDDLPGIPKDQDGPTFREPWEAEAFALAIKAVFVVLTFGGLASLWAAIAADMGASLLVVFNALRLLGGNGSRKS